MNSDMKEGTSLPVLKFLIFALTFIAVGVVLCMLWAFFGKSTETSLLVEGITTNAKSPVVVIDAGHGGVDGGATCLSALPEKDLNLEIAFALRDMLTASGVEVIMTRTEDALLTDPENPSPKKKSQDLSARLKVAKKTENAIFVSIHMNSFPIEKYNGLQVYYSPNDPNRKILADSIQSTVKKYIQSDNDRKTKVSNGNIYLLDNLNCPSVLIECGFLSNAEEAVRLNDKNYRQQLAFLICCSINDYIYSS
jgi:N-acetylmuramoyl-L-alanine amidase